MYVIHHPVDQTANVVYQTTKLFAPACRHLSEILQHANRNVPLVPSAQQIVHASIENAVILVLEFVESTLSVLSITIVQFAVVKPVQPAILSLDVSRFPVSNSHQKSF